MDVRTLRQTTVLLPTIHEDDLTEIGSLDGENVTGFVYGGTRLRELSLSGTHLVDGRITGLAADRVRLTGLAQAVAADLGFLIEDLD
ncbi:hypothetical protein JOL79_14795 [Microbispora sp. RL4-1S]|uniref:Uncharacterized protein n=1 Tax=Microbispora oryzae TaxID=2806554 RepID=A0A940WQ53_9ACTN|nr:hypothetical protein [Microbispora oryzae]MBP2705081.1 hypothetical protein [Microbispora oryzae]